MTDVRRISGLLPFAISQRLLADLHHGPTCYIASGDIQETWVPCSRLREHVPASPGAGALHAHADVTRREHGTQRGSEPQWRLARSLTYSTLSRLFSTANLGAYDQANLHESENIRAARGWPEPPRHGPSSPLVCGRMLIGAGRARYFWIGAAAGVDAGADCRAQAISCGRGPLFGDKME